MNSDRDVLDVERQFFTALIEGSVEALDRLLADDFLLIDVMRGSEVPKSALLAVLEAGQITFEAIEPVESRVRFYQTTAIVTGRTEMRVRFGDSTFSVSSRYTHVYIQQQGGWRMATAQGTPISD